MSNLDEVQFIRQYRFQELPEDGSKPGRVLRTVKVGEVYISHLVIDPGVITGNLYHQETRVITLVTRGRVLFTFKQVRTGERREVFLRPGDGIVHIPPFVAIASKNVFYDASEVLYFSNKPFRSGDDYPCEIMVNTTAI
ncbi:MAG: hypothetical protein HY984_01515 [Candidatus Magasanikbacteria bacterium]|nr:hypothetical protein [Candidatus Magasanikbacteria bacterium]